MDGRIASRETIDVVGAYCVHPSLKGWAASKFSPVRNLRFGLSSLYVATTVKLSEGPKPYARLLVSPLVNQ